MNEEIKNDFDMQGDNIEGDSTPITPTEAPIKETAINMGQSSMSSSNYLNKVVVDTATKATAVLLAFILLFTTFLSFAHPNAADAYFSLGLHQKAVVAAERDFIRKERQLNRITDTDTYNSFLLEKYMPSLSRLTDYSIAWSVRANNKKSNNYVIKYADLFLRQDTSISYRYSNAVNEHNISRMSADRMVDVYSYRAYLMYHHVRAAIAVDDLVLLDVLFDSYFEGDLLSRIMASQHTYGDVTRLFNDEWFLPNWAMGAYLESLLNAIDYSYPTAIALFTAFNSAEQVKSVVNVNKYSIYTFDTLINRYDGALSFTQLYYNIESVYLAIEEIRDSKDFQTLSSLDDRLKYMWYQRNLTEISYQMASIMSILGAMNTNSPSVHPSIDHDVYSYIYLPREQWLQRASSNAFLMADLRLAMIGG